MKTCIECKTAKPLTEFGARAVAYDGLNPRCRPCRRGYERRHYAGRAELERSRRKADVGRYKARNKALIQEHFLTHPCVDCGEADPIVLEFDHVEGEKVGNISRMRLDGVPAQRLLDEMAKCEVRCANCHRRATHRRRTQSLHPAT